MKNLEVIKCHAKLSSFVHTLGLTNYYDLFVNDSKLKQNKIRDLFKVKLYTIRSETKNKRERERDKHVNPSTDRGGS